MAETEAVLLRRFAGSGDAQAFAEIIQRYAGLVYSAALRVLTDVDRASDVAQDTFLQLAKDAGNVTGSLPGWLHRVATHKAIDQVRRDAARKHREAEYMAARPGATAEWKEISPHVDEGLNLLDPHLRSILILHFLEGRSTREIARAQGLSQATISRRIEAGVEQLRVGLRRRGILVAAGALGILLGENAVQAAPQALLTELGKIALISGSLAATTAGTGTASGLSAWAASALTAVKANAVAVAAAAVVVIGAGSAITYRQVTKPAESVAVAPVGLAARNADGFALTPEEYDSSTGISPTDGAPGAQTTAAAGSTGGIEGQRPLPRGLQGLPGPEAETDPRTYVPGVERARATVMSPSGLAQPAPGQPLSSMTVQPDRTPAEPVPGEAAAQMSAQVKESPYETVMRLRQEATAGKPAGPADPNLSAIVPTGPVVARAELKLVPPYMGSPGGILGLQQRETTIVKPPQVLETPPDAPREPVYFVVRAGDRDIQGVAYRSIRSPGEVMLWLDTDGDGLWSDEKAYVGRRLWIFSTSAIYEFGPVYLKQGETSPGGDAFYAQCSEGKWLTFWPAFYRDGKVLLDGKTYRVSVVDSDFDGRFNEWFVPPGAGGRDPGCDVLAIDFNGDGRFTFAQADRAEVMPLGRLVNIGGRCYGIEVAEDGSTIEFRSAEPVSGPSDLVGQQAVPGAGSDAAR